MRLAVPDAQGRTVRLTGDLQLDFALNQALSPFALAAIELLDRESIDYPLDVLSVLEATLDDPRQVLSAQLSKANIKIKLSTASNTQLSAIFWQQTKGDALLLSFGGRPDPTLTYSLMFSKNGFFNAGKTEEAKQRMAGFSPFNRIGRPEEIAQVVRFLLSDESSWVHGQVVQPNGGMA